jgi:hypothetical protein
MKTNKFVLSFNCAQNANSRLYTKGVKCMIFNRGVICSTEGKNHTLPMCIVQGDSEISLEKKCGVSFTQINSA